MRTAILVAAMIIADSIGPSHDNSDETRQFVVAALLVFFAMDLYELLR